MESVFAPVPMGVSVLLACAAAFTDVRRFKVYNLLTFPAIALGLLYHALANGYGGLASSGTGILVATLIMLFPYLLGAVGAGDVKFFMALGAWLGGSLLVPVFIIAVVATVLYGLIQSASNRNLSDLWLNAQISLLRFISLGKLLAANDSREDFHDWVNHKDRYKRLIPFSAMLALGLLITIIWRVSASIS